MSKQWVLKEDLMTVGTESWQCRDKLDQTAEWEGEGARDIGSNLASLHWGTH